MSKPKRDQQLKIMVSKRERELLTILADEEGRTVSNYVRWLIKVMYKRRTAK